MVWCLVVILHLFLPKLPDFVSEEDESRHGCDVVGHGRFWTLLNVYFHEMRVRVLRRHLIIDGSDVLARATPKLSNFWNKYSKMKLAAKRLLNYSIGSFISSSSTVKFNMLIRLLQASARTLCKISPFPFPESRTINYHLALKSMTTSLVLPALSTSGKCESEATSLTTIVN